MDIFYNNLIISSLRNQQGRRMCWNIVDGKGEKQKHCEQDEQKFTSYWH